MGLWMAEEKKERELIVPGLEPGTTSVSNWHDNQLHYEAEYPLKINAQPILVVLYGCKTAIAYY